MWHPPGGMRTPDRGSTTGNASWTDREPASGLPRRGERSESIPPSPPYFKKSSYASTGFFFACGTRRGDENPRPGVRQLAQPVGQTASLRAGCPSGASEASQSPPHRHIRDESLYASTGSFLLYSPQGGDENPRPGFDNWRSQLDRPRTQ